MSTFPDIERAILIGFVMPQESVQEAECLLEELAELSANLNIEVVTKKIIKLRKYSSAFMAGKGKVEEVIGWVDELEADTIVFDQSISPGQQRNWDKACGGEVVISDRQELILRIFQRRAKTKEATLQVELASLEYQLPRMKRAWTHLSRQRGGAAAQRDAGETQLEMDQRMIRDRIVSLKKELKLVIKQRGVERTRRLRMPLPTAAIVGYTNAGKSSLLNKLTEAEVYAEDKLFATLDPTTRRATLPTGQILLLTDTVGFLRRLPHRLVEAFKATLEEALIANFLIHVVDGSHPDAEAHFNTTIEVLKELGAENKRMITVFNKIDKETEESLIPYLRAQYPEAVFISVKTGKNLEQLLSCCEGLVEEMGKNLTLLIPHDRYDIINLLHEAGSVAKKEICDDGVRIRGVIPNRLLTQVKEFAVVDDKGE